jgi:hypothetical protein
MSKHVAQPTVFILFSPSDTYYDFVISNTTCKQTTTCSHANTNRKGNGKYLFNFAFRKIAQKQIIH